MQTLSPNTPPTEAVFYVREQSGRNSQMETKPKITGKFGKGNPGKPKGAKNKTTQSAMQAIEMAAEGLGGVSRLIVWAKSDEANERVFWGSIYTKLLPLQVAGDPDRPLIHKIIREIVRPTHKNG